MNETSRWLPRLDPPPGGPEQLRARLKERGRSRQYRPRAMAAVVSTLALITIAWLLVPALKLINEPAQTLSGNSDLTRSGNNAITVRNGAALELPSQNPNVRIYLVATRAIPGGSSGHNQPPI